VQPLLGASSASSGPIVARAFSARAALIIATVAIIAITGAAVFPSSVPSASAAATPPPRTVHDLGAAAAPALQPAPAADIGAQRFTGKVGQDLTRSLQAAGVPERQGREYIGVLGRAITLAGGLSIDDRFDLVVDSSDEHLSRSAVLYRRTGEVLDLTDAIIKLFQEKPKP